MEGFKRWLSPKPSPKDLADLERAKQELLRGVEELNDARKSHDESLFKLNHLETFRKQEELKVEIELAEAKGRLEEAEKLKSELAQSEADFEAKLEEYRRAA